jgi:tRNA(Arg) A34 adenosine deaminase TadA
MTDDEAMRRTIDVTRRGIAAGQSPFGAVIVQDGRVIAESHNTVLRDNDPTAHAEVNAIRAAAAALKTYHLHGCTLYSSCEPCAMCLAASHWAKIDRIVYGAVVADALRAGFSGLQVPARQFAELGNCHLIVEPGPLGPECAHLFDDWKANGNDRPY